MTDGSRTGPNQANTRAQAVDKEMHAQVFGDTELINAHFERHQSAGLAER